MAIHCFEMSKSSLFSIHGYQKTFKLNPTSGKLTVASYIDYETVRAFKLEIMTEDNGYPHFTFNKTFTLDVLDVNEAPNDLRLSNNKVLYNYLCSRNPRGFLGYKKAAHFSSIMQ